MAVTGKLFYLLVLKLPRFESEHRCLTTKNKLKDNILLILSEVVVTLRFYGLA